MSRHLSNTWSVRAATTTMSISITPKKLPSVGFNIAILTNKTETLVRFRQVNYYGIELLKMGQSSPNTKSSAQC